MDPLSPPPAPSWAAKYHDRHAWQRVAPNLPGLALPKRVRVYARAGQFLLNYWDPAIKKNRTEKVDGDLLAALSAARRVEDRLLAKRAAELAVDQASHQELVAAFVADLGRRADAGEVRPATHRY